jgi:hypothetical protein
MKDLLGNEFKAGQRVAFAKRSGNSGRMEIRKIAKVSANGVQLDNNGKAGPYVDYSNLIVLNSPQEFSLSLVTRLQDNGDGGYSMYVYNNDEELIQNHPRCSDFMKVDNSWKDVFLGCSDELREEILSGHDEYENGYLDRRTISVTIENGKARLTKPLSAYTGC